MRGGSCASDGLDVIPHITVMVVEESPNPCHRSGRCHRSLSLPCLGHPTAYAMNRARSSSSRSSACPLAKLDQSSRRAMPAATAATICNWGHRPGHESPAPAAILRRGCPILSYQPPHCPCRHDGTSITKAAYGLLPYNLGFHQTRK